MRRLVSILAALALLVIARNAGAKEDSPVAELVYIRAALAGPVADLILAEFQERASEHVGTGFHSSNASFARVYPYQGNDLAVAIMNTAPYARILEDGHQGYHLPERINWSGPNVRTSKDGRRYLIIPFRHYTPGSKAGGTSTMRARSQMSKEVYFDAKQALVGNRATPAARAARERLEAAGPRLSRAYSIPTFPTALRRRAELEEGRPGYTHRAGPYAGLTRRVQRTAGGGEQGAGFFTFRALTEDSVGWHIPAFPGYHAAARTVDAVRDDVRELVGDAVRQDVVELVRVAVGA